MMLRPPPEPFIYADGLVPAGLDLLKLDLEAAGFHVLGGPAGDGSLLADFARDADEVLAKLDKLICG